MQLCQYDTTGTPHVYRDIGEQKDVKCEATDDYPFALKYAVTWVNSTFRSRPNVTFRITFMRLICGKKHSMSLRTRFAAFLYLPMYSNCLQKIVSLFLPWENFVCKPASSIFTSKRLYVLDGKKPLMYAVLTRYYLFRFLDQGLLKEVVPRSESSAVVILPLNLYQLTPVK